MNAVPPPDDAAHLDTVLMADLTGLDTLVGRHVLRFLDADTGGSTPVTIADELTLAERLSVAADGVRARAARREREGEPLPLGVRSGDEERI
jgi:hypothetical protein